MAANRKAPRPNDTDKPATAVKKAQKPRLTKAEIKKLELDAASKKIAGVGKKEVLGFTNFLRKQGVVGLAVGLAIGTAAGDTVKKLVEGFITPIVQFIVGSRDELEQATWSIELWGRTADFRWGAFVSSLITLLATALVIYFIIHFLKLDRLDKDKNSS